MDEIARTCFAIWEAQVALEKARVELLKTSTHLVPEDLNGIGYGDYSDLVQCHSRNPANLHNLEVLLQVRPDKQSRSHFLMVLQSLEIETLRLFLRYTEDVVAHIEGFRTRTMVAIQAEQNDVLEALLEIGAAHFKEKDFTFFVGCTLEASDVTALDIILRWLERQGKTFDPNDYRIRTELIKLPVEYFDRLYLRGFDPFSTGYNGSFARCVINEGHSSLILRLYEMNVIQAGDYRKNRKQKKISQRYHFRQLLLANQNINSREKDVFLQRYLQAQVHPLPMVRALSREAKFFNRQKANSIDDSTVNYLNTLRPERNVVIGRK